MAEFFFDYGLFLLKTITIILAVLFLASGIVASIRRARAGERERIEVKNLNHHFEDMEMTLRYEMLDDSRRKRMRKEEKKRRKAQARKAKAGEISPRRRLFVINFKGDIMASAIAALREEITAIVSVAGADDEVVLRLESNGGIVNAYGLAASQLVRIKENGLRLTVAVDKVAASGGYMMACVGHKILAAPFAVIGSIGVMSELPNFHRLLKKWDIDYEQITAGEYKRTLTLFGENTEKARLKLTEQIEEAHMLFKAFVQENRPQVDISRVATGEFWYGRRAVELKLVDELMTSDDYLLKASREADIFEVVYKPKETLREKIAAEFEQMSGRAINRFWQRLTAKQYG